VRAAVYTRVSSEMQLEGYSLEAQLTTCQRLAAEREWEIVVVYTDEGLSAKTTARPRFRALMRDAKANRFDVVVVHKLDRLSRSVIDLLTTLHNLESLGVALVSASEQFDFTTPIGRVMLTMLAAFAQWYLDNLSAETAKGKRARAEAGLWNSAVPFGYQVDYKKDGGDGLAYPDEGAIEGVWMAFELCAAEMHSDADVAQALNEAGYRPQGRGDRALELFSKDTVTMMLQNRFYLGEVQYKGQWFEGVHEPIISEELFNRAQRARRRRRYKRSHSANAASRVYPLTGVARCARCGGKVRGANSAGYRYYRDPARDKGLDCDQKMISADKTEDALGAFLRKLFLPQDWQERVMEIIQEQIGAQRDVARDKERLEGQLERVKQLFVLGDMSEFEYRSERDRLRTQLAILTPPAMPDLEQAAEVLQNFGKIWEVATLQERRQIVHSLLETVYLDAEYGPVVAIELRAEFAALFEMLVYEPDDDGPVILKPGTPFPSGGFL
jgi:site-specific DNA recombinase